MAEFLAHLIRGVQAAFALAIALVFLAPLVMWIWPLIWPILLLGTIIGLGRALDALATRLEQVAGKG